MANSEVSMKLLINTQNNKVLFAEAGKECVDFLFHILSLPIATVIKLLKEQGMVGCLANLYESIENLNETYIEADKTKNSLLRPYAPSVPRFLLEGGSQPTGKVAHRCGYCNMTYVAGPPVAVGKASDAAGSFVKGVVTYNIMDDLVVKPISSPTSLSQFNVKDIASLKEKEVNITMKEAVMLLKASLNSKTVLTDVFLSRSDKLSGNYDMDV